MLTMPETHNQTSRKSSSGVALLRSEQGPCEPSKDFVREPERARVSHSEPEGAGIESGQPQTFKKSLYRRLT